MGRCSLLPITNQHQRKGKVMDIPCECLVREGPNGETVCRKCNGDYYACECSTRHSIRCPKHPDYIERKES